ncbi:MAG TPA: cyclic nucleotide-binding domain-containing protein [Candidatus Limnocylindrales bacterium]|nr:cyclic nucleotide-binding domain-containing protein [Candidatus Limnocylindrales bacterium]
MRVESSVTSVSWIPSEAIPGLMKLPFQAGPFHYDDPPSDHLDDVSALAASSTIRFANQLRAFIEVEDGRIVRYGHAGRGHMGRTRLDFGAGSLTFPAIPFPDLRPEPQVRDGQARFVQTAGGRVGVPMPRKVNRPPFVQFSPPLVWTTLALTLRADGSSSFDVVGASPFPRHWIYDAGGNLSRKVGLTDFRTWADQIFGEKTPWGAEDSPAVITEVETAVEREVSRTIMRGGVKPKIRTIRPGETLVEEGAEGSDLFLLLDGVLGVEVDGKPVAEVGPGAILGERALLESGRRSATLRAVTPARVAVAPSDQIDPQALAEIAKGHRRERP